MNMLDKLKKIIEMVRPDLSTYMRFPVEGSSLNDEMSASLESTRGGNAFVSLSLFCA